MKHNLSKLRAEAVAYLAKAHPEIPLLDIGLAVGWSPAAALSMASDAMRLHGGSRPRGAAAAAYTPNNVRKYDHKEILRQVKAHPELRYREIAELCECHHDSVQYVAHKAGIYRGFRRQKPVLAKSTTVQADGPKTESVGRQGSSPAVRP